MMATQAGRILLSALDRIIYSSANYWVAMLSDLAAALAFPVLGLNRFLRPGPMITSPRSPPLAALLQRVREQYREMPGLKLTKPHAVMIAALWFTVVGLVYTLVSIYPINAVLFEQAGGAHSPEEIRVMVRDWIFRDRLRFGIGLIGFSSDLVGLQITDTWGNDRTA